MAFTVRPADTPYQHHLSKKKKSILFHFSEWAARQEEKNHKIWAGGAVTAMSVVFFPLTMAVILVNGASFELIITAMSALVLVVISNLSAMSAKYTIPLFFFGILIDAGTITASFLIK